MAIDECDCPFRDGACAYHFPFCASRRPPAKESALPAIPVEGQEVWTKDDEIALLREQLRITTDRYIEAVARQAPAVAREAEEGARQAVAAYCRNNGPVGADVCNGVVAGYYAGLADAAPPAEPVPEPIRCLGCGGTMWEHDALARCRPPAEQAALKAEHADYARTTHPDDDYLRVAASVAEQAPEPVTPEIDAALNRALRRSAKLVARGVREQAPAVAREPGYCDKWPGCQCAGWCAQTGEHRAAPPAEQAPDVVKAPRSDRLARDETGIDDAAVLRAVADDVPDMAASVRDHLRNIADKIDGGLIVATIRCTRCGHKEADVEIRTARLQEATAMQEGGSNG